MVYRFSLTFPLLVILLLAGCSSYTPTEPATAPVEKKPDYTVVKPRQPPPSTTAAYQPLLDKAEQARQRGDYEQALALLERAQRIDADSADVYLAMARTHSARGDKSQARATAERGLLYCSGRSQCDALRAYAR